MIRPGGILSPVIEPVIESLTSAITAALGGFNPASLFADGSIGVLYDNNDLTAMFVDAAGTTPATVNGLVGLQLDKSQGLVLGADIYPSLDFNSGWSATNATVSTASSFVVSPAPGGVYTASGPLTLNKSYAVSFTWTASGSTTLELRNGTTGISPLVASVTGTSGTLTCYLVGASSTQFYFRSIAAVTITITGLSVRELPGNHRYQTTTGSKPILRGTPTGAELFTAYGTPGAGWSVAGATGTATTASSALPTTTAAVVGKFYRVTYTVTHSAGSVQLSFGGRTGVSRSAAGQYVEYFDNALNTNALTATGTGFTGTVRIDEVKDVSAGSVTAPYGLQYDGADDFLQTASVNFSATDKMFVCAGVRKFSNTVQVVLEQSINVDNFDNAFNFAVNALAGPNWYVSSGSKVQGQISARESTASAPVLGVVSSAFNRGVTGTGQISLRVNGLAGSPTYVGTGSTANFRNDILYFGRRGGTTLPFNGLDFGFVIVGKTLTAAQISSTERWMAQRTGVSI